ncbi:MAG: hypothetical protein Q8O38_07655 [Sulfurimicrobium sp.]|nr:hypothetical protein [Sulfurimicrobium sp.]
MMKKYLTAKLCPALFILATTLALPSFAADDSTTGMAGDGATSNMDILREKISADKKLVVANNMNLTDAEAKGFWPVYDAYQKDLQKINERLVKVINDYALAYNKGAVLNVTAKQLLDEAIAIELAEAKLKQSYVPKLGKALPAAKVARYIQIENKIRAIIRYSLAEGIPLVE